MKRIDNSQILGFTIWLMTVGLLLGAWAIIIFTGAFDNVRIN